MKREDSQVLAQLAFAALLGLPATAPAQVSAVARDETAYLLDFLERSGCEFARNGNWHAAADARKHLEKKLAYMVQKGLLARAEDFVEMAASKSSASGKSYEVRCQGSAPVTSGVWFSEALSRHRKRAGG